MAALFAFGCFIDFGFLDCGRQWLCLVDLHVGQGDLSLKVTFPGAFQNGASICGCVFEIQHGKRASVFLFSRFELWHLGLHTRRS